MFHECHMTKTLAERHGIDLKAVLVPTSENVKAITKICQIFQIGNDI